MKKLILLSLTIIACAFNSHTYGQSDTLDSYIERLIEAYVESNADDIQFDFAQNFENLDDIIRQPFDVNEVSEEQLANLFFLNAIQRQAIIGHRQNYGAYIALEELQTIDALDIEAIKILQFFLTVNPQPTNVFKYNNMFKSPAQTLFVKHKTVLQNRKGYIADALGNTAYKGDPHHLFLRYKMESNNNFKMGFTAEKDAGESFFKGSNKKGFDFYSGYAFIQNISHKIKAVALGDYTLSFGQGLVLHNDFGAGKSSYVMNIKKSGRTLRPYSSVNESNYFRGIAITTLPYRNVELTLLYSSKKVDGSIRKDTLDLDIETQATAILRSGYHRTASEIANQNNLTQTNYGGRLIFKSNKIHLGIHHLNYSFSSYLSKADQLYNLYAFKGLSLSNTGIDYNFVYKNASLFGELAMSNNGGIAHVHGILMPLDRHVDLSVSYRNYQKNYVVLEANALGEGSLPINEKAIYAGIEVRPTNTWKVSTYIDMWQNPWLKYRIDAPSLGKELLFRLEYNIKRKFNAYFQYRYESKYNNTSKPNEKIDYTTNVVQHRWRFHMAQKVSKALELRSRAELVMYAKEKASTKGYLAYQDVLYKPIGKPYSFTCRYALFDTKGYDTRIYAYENDILYEFANPFYANSGKRAYFNFRHKLTKHITWEARYAITSYNDLKVISKGSNEQIDGSVKSEVKLQVKFSF